MTTEALGHSLAQLWHAAARRCHTNQHPDVFNELFQSEQCFANRTGVYLLDLREDHHSDPPTRWFIAETYFGRRLKIAFIDRGSDVVIRSAFEPNAQETEIYNAYGK